MDEFFRFYWLECFRVIYNLTDKDHSINLRGKPSLENWIDCVLLRTGQCDHRAIHIDLLLRQPDEKPANRIGDTATCLRVADEMIPDHGFYRVRSQETGSEMKPDSC